MIQWRLARYIICSPGIKFSSTYPIGSSSKPDDEKGTGYFSRFSKDQSSFQNQQERKVACPLFAAALVLGAMTYLKMVATGIFEEDGVVTGFPWLGNFMSG